MRFRPAFLAIVLALSAGRSFALEPAAPPSPVDSGTTAKHSLTPNAEDAGKNVFIGHFGETVRLPYFWAADARMQGPMERVNFHFKTVDPMKMFSAPFSPEAKDYVPENFARLRLMQMLVIPKDVPGGYPSLEKLREAKSKELSETGNPYDLRKVGEYPWPPETFWVSISTPYPLFQLYTQSDKYFFIVTSGASPYAKDRKDPVLANSVGDLCGSLSTYLDQFAEKLANRPKPISTALVALLPWGGICAVGIALGFLPKRGIWLSRLNLMGRTMVGLTSISLLIAIPLLFISWRQGLDKTINEGSILLGAGLVMPWACTAISSWLNGRNPWRLFGWSLVANGLPIAAGYMIARDFHSGKVSIIGTEDFVMLSITLCALGLANAIAFALAHRQQADISPNGRSA
ncbi:MAG: hypothetical protein HYX59_09160 [Elusimicrobia bacterium]|nr:hypothetical protein [Elusimicrobiota bacterium]